MNRHFPEPMTGHSVKIQSQPDYAQTNDHCAFTLLELLVPLAAQCSNRHKRERN
jgi:hypothetical protein